MNQTKKMTQGAMMLAIVGALILIDRMSSYWFSELIVLIMPVVIIMYSGINDIKDGLLLSVGLIIISFLLGNLQFTYLIYVPVGIITGIAYSMGMKHNLDKRTLMFIAIATYVIGEILATFIIYPLIGFPIKTMIEEYRISLNSAGNLFGTNYEELFGLLGLDFASIIVLIFILSTIIIGAMEGLMIHLISVYLLKRFKIKDLGNINIWDIKPNPTLAYISFLSLFSTLFIRGFENETLYYVGMTISILGAIVLLYYGYLFLILYGTIVLHRNVGAFFVILAFVMPLLLTILMILGFLYGSGPLRRYLESRVENSL